MKYLLAVVALFFLPLFASADTFKVASYNVENLFDDRIDGTEYEDYTPGKHNWSARMVEKKLTNTAEVICELDADIVGLQEIENANILAQLLGRLEKVGCAYQYSAISHKKGAAIQVAVLSRLPIIKSKDIQVSYAQGVRNILEAEVDVGGDTLTVFVNHWKSRAYKGYESKRIAYAKALQKRIDALPSSKSYIILGDFNSDYNAYLTLEPKLNDTNGKTAFNDVLKTKIGRDLVEKTQMPNATKGVHYSLWKELPLEQRWSHNFYGKKSSIDQIVLPQTMFDGAGVDYVNNSFGVLKAPFLFTKKGYINRWEYKNKKHTGKGYSDHLPVYALFSTNKYVKKDPVIQPKITETTEKKSIEALYDTEALEYPVKLEDVVVLYKKGNNALIKQHPQGRGIFLYGCAGALEVGYRYDLRVEGIKTYHGLKEITHAYMLKKKEKVSLEGYYKDAHWLSAGMLQQNEMLKEVQGVYDNGYVSVEGFRIPVYFKNKKLIPSRGSKLKVHYGHLSYYKKLQLVLYDKNDFSVLE